jgi:DAK2 domain fusion protein YloV
LERLAPADLRLVLTTYRDALRAHQEELNRLNVYPVPDGDTGTNMALTIESVVAELEASGATDDGMRAVCSAIAHGSLMGARGNSGVILSQVLRALADTFSPLDAVGAPAVVAGLRRAADAAYQAVLRPVEGTMLTVVRSTAESVEYAIAEGGATLETVLERATAAARAAVVRTPELLPVLKDAGVVDAGGRGFELLVASWLNVVTGRPLPRPEVVAVPAAVEAHLHPDASGLRYEVMYLLHADDDDVPQLRRAWAALGDSIVVVGGDGVWNCHVHTNDIGGAVEAGIAVGRPEKIRVTDLLEQVEDLVEAAWIREHVAEAGTHAAPGVAEPVETGVVAVAVGEGLRRLLVSLGVQHVVAGGQSMNPSTAQILEAVEQCAATGVVVLPNNHNIVPVANQVPGLTDRPVDVVPTTAVVEALSALVVYDADAPLADNVAAMSEAAARVRSGEVTQAVRDSVAACGPIRRGDWIAITREGVRAAQASPLDAVVALVADLVDDDSELVTLIAGAEARPADVARIEEHVLRAHPHVELELHQGDQPLYPYLVGVE